MRTLSSNFEASQYSLVETKLQKHSAVHLRSRKYHILIRAAQTKHFCSFIHSKSNFNAIHAHNALTLQLSYNYR